MSNSPMPSLGEVFKALLVIAGIVAIAAFGIGIVIKTAGESLVTFFSGARLVGYGHYRCAYHWSSLCSDGHCWWNRI